MFEKEAEEYAHTKHCKKCSSHCEKKCILVKDDYETFKQGAEFGYNKGKAETALLSQHIIDLQKDKGNLTDRVRELEQQIEKIKNSDTLCKLIGEQKRKITELEAQLEKLKPYRCENHFQVSETGRAVVCYRVYDCKSCGQFKEIKEK